MGQWPANLRDDMHQADGGYETHGVRPQDGRKLLSDAIHALQIKYGIEYAIDDVSGEELDPTLMKEARQMEMKYVEEMKVYDRVPRAQQKETGGKIIGVRWVDVNKGDATKTDYRSRLVGQ